MLINVLISHLTSPYRLMRLLSTQLRTLMKYHLNGEKLSKKQINQTLLKTPDQENEHVG